MTVASPDEMRRHDALYEPFPAFADWPRLPEHLVAQWGELVERLSSLRQEVDEEAFAAIREEQLRAAAWDTGAIEGLYTTDRGFTITVATQAAHWEAEVRREKGGDALALFEAQLAAYRQALDVATEATPISEAWIRHLHEVATAAQEKYEVHTAAGKQVHDLPKGEYKHHPNHIEKPDGSVHAHAPVAATGAEMARLVKDMRGEDFASAHPIEQASYAHYALVRVHPFADGNGRVARALASVFTLREASLPLVVYADERAVYLDALEAADAGRPAPFLRVCFETLVDTALDAIETGRLAGLPEHLDLDLEWPDLDSFSLDQQRRVALAALARAKAALASAFGRIEGLGDAVDVVPQSIEASPGPTAGYRSLADGPGDAQVSFELLLSSKIDTTIRERFMLHPMLRADDTALFDVMLKGPTPEDSIGFRLASLVPVMSERAKRRLEGWAEGRLRVLARRIAAAQAAPLADPPTDGPASSGG